MKNNKLLLIAIILAIQSCTSYSEKKNEHHEYQEDFVNVLKIGYSPSDLKDIETNLFSDLGAWHAYSVPLNNNSTGGFLGPLLMDLNGVWLSDNFAKFNLSINSEKFDFQSNREVKYYPGRLEILSSNDLVDVVQTVIFVDNRTSVINNSIKNKSDKQIELVYSYSGNLYPELDAELGDFHDYLNVRFKNGMGYFKQKFIPQPKSTKLSEGNKSYTSKFEIEVLSAHDERCIQVIQKHDFVDSGFLEIDFEKNIKQNKERWNSYLESYFKNKSEFLKEEKYKRLAAKSIITLIANWRSKAKDLLHDGTFPSASYQGFYGFWSWDSWKHAVAYAEFAPEIAKQNFYSMFDYQDQHGMVADCIYTDKDENNWRDTKPPLASWGVWKIYEKTQDKEFLIYMLERLESYHSWWYKNRDHDQNYLCEYGSTDGTRIAAAWESGMDNAVRFDDAIMLRNNEDAWSLNQESVDLNIYLYSDKLYLAQINKTLGRDEVAKKYMDEAENLKALINKFMYSEIHKYYYDIELESKNKIEIEGPEAWVAMWSGMADKEKAEGIRDMILREDKFNTRVPFPTLARDNEKFNPLMGYWRGPVWLDQAYFAVKGLRRYNYNDEADSLSVKIFENAHGLLDDRAIRENYHPLTGEGLNAHNFSWSAAHILMMLKQ